MPADLINPKLLHPNPWNTNRLSPEAELKLENSIERLGLFKPVVIRTLPNGDLQILGGQHRAAAAERVGLTEIPVFNLGDISDATAKEIGIVDNGRYGQDDSAALTALLATMGSALDLASFMPFDMQEISSLNTLSEIDLEDLGLDESTADPIAKSTKEPKTHATMRFRVPLENNSEVEDRVRQVIADQGFDDSDAMINAGDALVYIILNGTK